MFALSSDFFDTSLLRSSDQRNLNVICESIKIVLTFPKATIHAAKTYCWNHKQTQFPIWFKIVHEFVEDAHVKVGVTNQHTNSLTGFLTYAADKSTVRQLLRLEVSHFQTQFAS